VNLNIYSQSQQEDALHRALGRCNALMAEHGQAVATIEAKCRYTGLSEDVLRDFYSHNLDEGHEHAHTLCEGILLGIAFTLELQEG
jgi:hypothetical protein